MKKPILLGASAALVALAAFSASGGADAGGRQLVQIAYGEFQPVFAGLKPGDPGKTMYVLDYKLTNVIDKGVTPRVHLELRTETGKTFGDSYDGATFRAAAKALRRETAPASTVSIRSSELGAGASVDGLANFGAIDPNADDFEVRVYGLWDPVFRDRNGRTWAEKRVLVLKYSRTGDEYDRQYDAIRLTSAKEEVEGDVVELGKVR
jgi:hypothetical protein